MSPYNLETALRSYMSSRCDVSSQHKLPGREELYESISIGSIWSQSQIDRELDRLIADGSFFAYGPYISDREIDVL